jgi:hypothetical protein
VEFKPSNTAFTWDNNQDNLIMAAHKLFASTNTGQNNIRPPKLFRLDKWWLEQQGFYDMVWSM